MNSFPKRALDFIICLIVVLFSTRGNDLVNEPIALTIAFTFIFLVALFRRVPFGKNFALILSVLVIFYVAYYLKFGEFTPGFYMRYLSTILMIYIVIKMFQQETLFRIEKVVFILTLISFPIYFFGFFNHAVLFDIIKSLQSSINLTTGLDEKIDYGNIFIYTVRPYEERFRNSGYMWEPGPFGIMSALFLMVNFIQNGFKITKRSVVYIAAIVTSVSTTAFIMLLVVLAFYTLNKGKFQKVMFIPAVVILGIIIWNQSFVGEKIMELSEDPEEQLENFYSSKNKTETQSLGRFAGLLYNIDNLQINPVFGVGGHEEVLYRRKEVYLYSTNGLGHYLMVFGILGFILLLTNLYKTSKKLIGDLNFKGWYFIVLVYLVAGFGFIIIVMPLFFFFQVYYLARNPKRRFINLEPQTVEISQKI